MNVYFYSNFSKKRNSTKQPAGTGTLHDCRMKNDCSISNPVFLINDIDLSYNYCRFNDRYYFITDIVLSTNKIYEVSCSIDVLATYKTAIGNYNAFVERSASSFDGLVTDNLITQSNNISHMDIQTINMPVAQGDVYMVPVFGRNGVLVYVFPSLTDASVFFNTGQMITIDGDSLTREDWLLALKNAGWVFAGSDVTSYMGDISFTPYLPPVVNPYITTNQISFGFTTFESPSSLYNTLNPNNYYYTFTQPLTDPSNIYNDFRAYDPRYSQYKIYLPGCGVYDISPADAGKKDLYIRVMMDFLNGTVCYKIYHNNGSDVAMFEGKFASGVPALGAKMDIFGILQDTASAASSLISENYGSLASSLVGASQKVLQPQVNARSGGSGNGAVLKYYPHILYGLTNYASKDIPTVVAGRPCYRNAYIRTLSGFVKCGNASVDIQGFESEKNEVNSLLNSGFYYE